MKPPQLVKRKLIFQTPDKKRFPFVEISGPYESPATVARKDSEVSEFDQEEANTDEELDRKARPGRDFEIDDYLGTPTLYAHHLPKNKSGDHPLWYHSDDNHTDNSPVHIPGGQSHQHQQSDSSETFDKLVSQNARKKPPVDPYQFVEEPNEPLSLRPLDIQKEVIRHKNSVNTDFGVFTDQPSGGEERQREPPSANIQSSDEDSDSEGEIAPTGKNSSQVISSDKEDESQLSEKPPSPKRRRLEPQEENQSSEKETNKPQTAEEDKEVTGIESNRLDLSFPGRSTTIKWPWVMK